MLQYHCPNYNRLIGYKGLCWLCKADKKREQALNLRKEEIEEMQKYCIEHVEGLDCMREPEITYFWNCLSYHNIICEELQRAAVKKEAYYPCAIYYKAPEDVRDSLIAALMNCNDVRIASHLMECLAMQGDDKSLEILLELKKIQESGEKIYMLILIFMQNWVVGHLIKMEKLQLHVVQAVS